MICITAINWNKKEFLLSTYPQQLDEQLTYC